MTDKEVLTREEIDALLTSVDEGDVDAGAPVQVDGKEVRRYDLTTRDKVVRGRLPTLEVLGEKFARQLRVDLQQLLRYSIDVGAGGVQILNYGEYAASLYVPTSITVTRFAPLKGQGLVVMDAKLISRMVDQFFGGDGKNITLEGRDFTPTEKRVIQRILEIVYRDLADAWSEALPVEPATISSEINPALVNLFTDDDVMMVNTYHIELESGGGEIHITLPYSSLEPYREILDTSVKTEDVAPDAGWRPALAGRLLDCQVPLECAIADRAIRLRELLDFKVGDVINVEMPDVHLVRANEMPVFYARLGESKGNLALEFVGRGPERQTG